MGLLRFLGIGGSRERRDERESDTVRRIASQLERLDPEQAKYLAAFAYVLARIANADLRIEESETEAMEETVQRIANLSAAEAALVVQIAQSQAMHLGGTQDYVVTRQFRQIASREQRGDLLQCLYAVAAADGTISSEESAEIVKIGEELGFTRAESNSLRSQYRDKLAEFQT
ncbi:MAG: TerB family tellurite resistance protein [Myxococcota bacterium]